MRVGRGSSLWLIRSNGRILGPYSEKQVGDLLRERMITPIDEASLPYGRWNYIREISGFAKVVEEIRVRNLMGSGDDTTTLGDQDDIDSRTATITPLSLDDRTQDIYIAPENNIRDVSFKASDDVVIKSSEITAYTHQGDLQVKKQTSETARWLWVLTIVVIFMSIAAIVFRRHVAQPIHNKAIYDASTVAAMEFLESGDYAAALDNFKKAYAIDPTDKSIFLYLGILHIQVENQSFMGRKLLENILLAGGSDLKRAHTGLGLSYLKESDLQTAEAHFNKALEQDENYKPAIINMGALAFLLDDWGRAEKYFMRAMRDEKTDGAEVLMLVESLIRLYQSDKEVRHLDEAAKFLQEFTSQSTVYRLEMRIAQAYLHFLKGQQSTVYSDIDEILDMDFFETENHRMNIFVYRGLISWSTISQWCLGMTEKLDPVAHVIAFESLCLLKSGEVVEANKKIDDAMAQAPRDPVVLSANAILLAEMNANDKMSVIIDKAIENDTNQKLTQPLRIKAKFCQQNDDYDCQKKYWQKVIAKDTKSLAALAGLAQVELQNRDIISAKQYLVRGLRESSSYRPFYKLNKSISRSEDREKARGL